MIIETIKNPLNFNYIKKIFSYKKFFRGKHKHIKKFVGLNTSNGMYCTFLEVLNEANNKNFLPDEINKRQLPKQYLDRLNQYKTPGKTMTRPAAVKSSTATKTARKVIANRAAKSRPAAVKVKTATKTARKATATRTATKKAKSKPTEDTGVLKYSKALGNGKYEYKYVKKR